MIQEAKPVVVCWEAPPWAEHSEIDEQAVIHYRTLGTYHDADQNKELDVRLVQRDEMDFANGAGTISRTPLYITVGGERWPLDQADRVTEMLSRGLAVADGQLTFSTLT